MKKILFVDDDPVFHYIYLKIVKVIGVECEVRTAHNGKEALEIITENKHDPFTPDYIFVDLNMPVMDGFRFIQNFHALQTDENKNTTIIVLTSSNNNDDRCRAKGLGIENYIVKPIQSFELSQILGYSESSVAGSSLNEG
jgi:CheY-like chemotaxis protein